MTAPTPAMMPNVRALALAVSAAAVAISVPRPFGVAWLTLSRWAARHAAGSRLRDRSGTVVAIATMITGTMSLLVPDQLMWARRIHVAQAIRGWQATGTLLTFLGRSGYRPLTDDPGIYLAAPLFSNARSPGVAMEHALGFAARIVLLALMGATLWRYRRLWCLATARFLLLGACCAGAVLVAVRASQQYWFPVAAAWLGMLLLSPRPDYVAPDDAGDRFRPAPGWAILAFAAACWFLALGRESTNVVGAATLLTAALSREVRLAWRIACVVLGLALLPAAELTATGIYHLRDRALTKGGFALSPYRAAHPRWHSIYAGLALPPGPLGLTYADSSTINAVHARNPEVRFPSAAYDREARRLVFATARAHPWLVARQFLAKGGLMLAIAFVIWAPLLVRARIVRDGLLARAVLRYGLLILAGLLPAILVAPVTAYGAAGVVAAILSLGMAPAALTSAQRSESGEARC